MLLSRSLFRGPPQDVDLLAQHQDQALLSVGTGRRAPTRSVCKGSTSGDNIARFAIICQPDEVSDRDSLDRMLIFGEAHLRQILSSYAVYYNEVRTHLALGKDAPLGRAVQRSGDIVAIPILSGLHHHYVRI
jgi:hypothetical protein